MRLEYQLPSGAWYACGDRTDEFLDMCVRFGNLPDRATVLATLANGYKVRNDPNDWYSVCRDGEAADALEARARAQREAHERDQEARHGPVLNCRSCGQSGRSGNYPFSTNPRSSYCDDCR